MASRGHLKSSALSLGTPSPVLRGWSRNQRRRAVRELKLFPRTNVGAGSGTTGPASGRAGPAWWEARPFGSVLRRPPPVLFVSTLSVRGRPQIFGRGQHESEKSKRGGAPPGFAPVPQLLKFDAGRRQIKPPPIPVGRGVLGGSVHPDWAINSRTPSRNSTELSSAKDSPDCLSSNESFNQALLRCAAPCQFRPAVPATGANLR
jgi:hypothetical protein